MFLKIACAEKERKEKYQGKLNWKGLLLRGLPAPALGLQAQYLPVRFVNKILKKKIIIYTTTLFYYFHEIYIKRI